MRLKNPWLFHWRKYKFKILRFVFNKLEHCKELEKIKASFYEWASSKNNSKNNTIIVKTDRFKSPNSPHHMT